MKSDLQPNFSAKISANFCARLATVVANCSIVELEVYLKKKNRKKKIVNKMDNHKKAPINSYISRKEVKII
jgi:hypothetical protein